MSLEERVWMPSSPTKRSGRFQAVEVPAGPTLVTGDAWHMLDTSGAGAGALSSMTEVERVTPAPASGLLGSTPQ